MPPTGRGIIMGSNLQRSCSGIKHQSVFLLRGVGEVLTSHDYHGRLKSPLPTILINVE